MTRLEIKEFNMSFGEYKDVAAVMPCSLYSALRGAGLIPDPYYGRRAEELLGNMSGDADFVARFNATAQTVTQKYAYLVVRGVDTVAEIYLNDCLLGKTDNVNRKYIYDVKGAIKVGENTLTVRCLAEGLTSSGKPAFTLGTDYSSPMPDMGILGGAELLTFESAAVSGVTLSQKHDGGSVTVGIKLDMLGGADGVRAVATLVSGAGQIYYGGITHGYGSITVRDPLYWWPRGLGVQNLYRLTVNLYGETDIVDTYECRIGLRTVEADGGTRVKLNGISILPMGALLTPECNLLAARTGSRAERIVEAAVAANHNSLYISSDGVYPTDRFLELCDEAGIMLFAETPLCPPVSERDSAVTGFSDELMRVATHPSLVAVAERESSEISDALYTAARTKAPDAVYASAGDALWGRDLPSVIAYPSDRTLSAIGEGSQLNPHSAVIEWQTSGKSLELFPRIAERYLCPTDPKGLTYATQMVAADLAEERIIRARLSAGATESAFYSRLIDPRPAVSDGALDYFCRPRALLHRAADLFAPILAIGVYDGGRVTFYVSNERKSDLTAELYYRLLDNKNNTLRTDSMEITAPRGGTCAVLELDLSHSVTGHETEYYLEYGLKEGTTVHSRRTLLFTKPKYLELCDPTIRTKIVGSDREFALMLSATAFARGVSLDLEGVDAVFDDNFFDVTSPAPMKIHFRTQGGVTSAEHLSTLLRVRSLYDLGR